MESYEDSNCLSMSDSISLYERYMRSFSVVDHLVENENQKAVDSSNSEQSSCSGGNIDLSVVTNANDKNKHCRTAETEYNLINEVIHDNLIDKGSSLDADVSQKLDSPCTSLAASSLENSSQTVEHSLLTDKSNHVSSEETKQLKQPVFITSTMENSNNAVDSVLKFRDVRHSESVFKLPISELSFIGTLKHVKKLQPIVDPITALSCSAELVLNEGSVEACSSYKIDTTDPKNDENFNDTTNDKNVTYDSRLEKTSESTGDSQYEDCNVKKNSNGKWDLDKSYSSFETSFDSGVRSPDMFSDEDDDNVGLPQVTEPFWSFMKDYETYDRIKVKKVESILSGVPPPPSITVLKTNVTEMLKKYYCYLPMFNEKEKQNISEENSMTPPKRVSLIKIPEHMNTFNSLYEQGENVSNKDISNSVTSKEVLNVSLGSVNDEVVDLKMNTEIEAKETTWPEVLKCRYHDVYYNVTKHSEKFALLSARFGERYVRAETNTSVNIYSGGLQSPSSATKRKEIRLKMAQQKSPSSRLSHLARRRQTFCSAATINEKAYTSNSKMVLIDKNFFPHRKLINSAERKSPRTRRTPGKKTPKRKTPGKKTPKKTPKTRSGGSSRKKAMRRLLIDSDAITRTQPSRESLKRALFVSPEGRKPVPTPSSVPVQAMKSKRALFNSPERQAETKSSDGTESDRFLKRKLSLLDDIPETSRSKIAKSLSFSGDGVGSASKHMMLHRRASEMCTSRPKRELSDLHRQKLLWAVTQALRIHGWVTNSPGFIEKTAMLAKLLRKLFTMPTHAAKLAAPQFSTSETMLKLARQYVFAIIQGKTVEECYQQEQTKLANEGKSRLTGYISANAYQQFKSRQNATSTFTSQIKENTCTSIPSKQDQQKSCTKNILQDKLVNIDSSSNSSSSGFSTLEKTNLTIFRSNSMPSFEEAAKMRARRQISFDNVDFPKR